MNRGRYFSLSDLALKSVEKLSESLKMHDLTFAEITDYVGYVRVVGYPQDIVVCRTGFLLCCRFMYSIAVTRYMLSELPVH